MADNENWLPGTFWLADEPDNKVHGRLYFSEDFRLELEGSLTSAIEEWTETDDEGNVLVIGGAMRSEEPGPFTVLGNLRDGSRRVSLFECTTVGRSGDFFMSADAAQTVRPIFGLRGEHLDDPLGITGAKVEVQHLTAWSQAPGFKLTLYNDGRQVLAYSKPEEESVLLANGATLGLSYSLVTQRAGPAGGGFSRTVSIEVDGFPAVSYREAQRLYEVPLSSLVTLCLLRDSPAVGFSVRRGNGDWLEGLPAPTPGVKDDETALRPWNHLLMMPDIGLGGFARWLDRVDALGPLPPLVAAAAGADVMHLERMLAELTSVAEGLHSRLFEEKDAPTDRPTFKRVKKAVEEALSDEDASLLTIVKRALEGMRHASYRKRLARLRDHVGDVVEGIYGKNFALWSDYVTDCRNEFAHRDTDFITPDSSGKYAAVVYSLRWLLVSLLLLETGISSETLRAKTQGSQAFRFFLQQAPDMLPDVYGEAAADDERGAASELPPT